MERVETNNTAPRWLILAAFAAVYLIWGSTYLGIKYAIETLPPFLMAGIRFLIAGGLLYLWAAIRKDPKPTIIQWKNSAVIGGLLLLLGNGVVVWAEHFIDSSTAALLITLEPVWVIMLLWLFQNKKPSIVLVIAMAIAVIGMILLTGITGSSNTVDIRGVIGISFSTLAWAVGSLYTIRANVPSSPIRSTAMQMICGGTMLFLVGIIGGEWSQINIHSFSEKSVVAFLYLTLFGSIVGYTAYSFLLKHAHPNQVSTYAYVNPVIAVYLGWLMAGEAITTQTIIASVLLISAVAMITRFSKK
jgi:drug/metabolite transporter (DMT)-like permease